MMSYYFADFSTSWPWYLTRASGIVAGLLLICLLITGITQYTGHMFKFMEPIRAWANHRTLGIAFIGAVAIHAGSLLLDRYVQFSIFDIILPFFSDYKRMNILGLNISFAMGLGIVASYMLAVIALTTWKLMRRRPRIWKTVHYLAYVLIGCIFLHSILIGTEFKNGLWRSVWIGLHVLVLGFIVLRLTRAGSLRNVS